jgi:SAM-dependent methyltransferase
MLNFGCGRKPIREAGWVNLDLVQLPDVDVCCDIFRFPYPFAGSTFDHILCSHVLEHVPHRLPAGDDVGRWDDGLLLVMAELHRILKSGGTIEIRGPHPRQGIYYFNNMTHYRAITEWTFESLVDAACQSSCVAFWTETRFSSITFYGDKFTDPPFGWELLRSAMRCSRLLTRLLGRPSELVIILKK